MKRALLLLLNVGVVGTSLAMSPLEKNDPNIDEGMSAFDRQDFETALKKFDAAAQVHPTDARAQFNRGTALHKLQRNDEAREAFRKAEELDRDGSLKNKIHYNLGNVAAEEQKREEAIAEYRKALRANPSDQLSRHNMEVVMKNLPPKEQQGPDGGKQNDAGNPDAGTPDSGTTDAGRDAGNPDGGPQDGGEKDGGTPDAGPADAGQSDAGRDGGLDGGDKGGDGGQGDAGRGDGGEGDQESKGDAGSKGDQRGDGGSDGGAEESDAGVEEPADMKSGDGGSAMSKKEAEKLLDAFKSNEKNMQLWRFRQKTQKNDTHGKDW